MTYAEAVAREEETIAYLYCRQLARFCSVHFRGRNCGGTGREERRRAKGREKRKREKREKEKKKERERRKRKGKERKGENGRGKGRKGGGVVEVAPEGMSDREWRTGEVGCGLFLPNLCLRYDGDLVVVTLATAVMGRGGRSWTGCFNVGCGCGGALHCRLGLRPGSEAGRGAVLFRSLPLWLRGRAIRLNLGAGGLGIRTCEGLGAGLRPVPGTGLGAKLGARLDIAVKVAGARGVERRSGCSRDSSAGRRGDVVWRRRGLARDSGPVEAIALPAILCLRTAIAKGCGALVAVALGLRLPVAVASVTGARGGRRRAGHGTVEVLRTGVGGGVAGGCRAVGDGVGLQTAGSIGLAGRAGVAGGAKGRAGPVAAAEGRWIRTAGVWAVGPRLIEGLALRGGGDAVQSADGLRTEGIGRMAMVV